MPTGITMMSVDNNPTTRCLDIVKTVSPDTVTVVGGPHPTLALEEVAQCESIDYIVTHEGEITFPNLLGAIEGGIPPQDRVPSRNYRQESSLLLLEKVFPWNPVLCPV